MPRLSLATSRVFIVSMTGPTPAVTRLGEVDRDGTIGVRGGYGLSSLAEHSLSIGSLRRERLASAMEIQNIDLVLQVRGTRVRMEHY